MRDKLQNILNDYQEAYGQTYTDHPLANLLRQEIPKIIGQSLTEPDRYIIKGSAGAGNWSAIPWIAIFDILITDTAQSGYYPVFLFKDDMRGFYLSLNQGVTEIKEKYKERSKTGFEVKVRRFSSTVRCYTNKF